MTGEDEKVFEIAKELTIAVINSAAVSYGGSDGSHIPLNIVPRRGFLR